MLFFKNLHECWFFLLSCSSSLGKYFVEMIVVEQPRVLLEAFILFKKYLKYVKMYVHTTALRELVS